MPVNPTDDQPADEHHNAFETEIPMICWIKKKCPHFPVPIMRHVVRRSEVEPHTFAIMEKLPGVSGSSISTETWAVKPWRGGWTMFSQQSL